MIHSRYLSSIGLHKAKPFSELISHGLLDGSAASSVIIVYNNGVNYDILTVFPR